MRTKRWISGLDNSQKIRVVVVGVGFYTTDKGAFDLCFTSQRNAVTSVLFSLGCNQLAPETRKVTGIARRERVYNEKGERVEIDVQIDLV